MSSRKQEVFSKLDYVSDQYQTMMGELFRAKRDGQDPKHLTHAVSDILSNSRECFDYLGQDILEKHILPLTRNTKLLQDYQQGRVKAYFPFYESQLQKKALYAELRLTNASLHKALISFTRDISMNNKIPNTLFEYGLFYELRDIVNHKKHDRLVALVSEQQAEILIESPGMQVLIPKDRQQGWTEVVVGPDTEMTRVQEYRFEYNKREIADFCMFAHRATEIIMRKFYDEFFDS
ncbi:hypothetical protein [Vibrio parahaemolyticus]|uniref:hypothetical protein n=1 Tax=Vibrio parahaemolyticus TaxID=670 RepID=UPI00226A07E5|nr:hypothetical protein [Vibrio parahaemolyticus]MCX8892252.1 hypothetical protein [Vibrio parahaemolyticus]